jgi:hypothetical protein
VGDLRAAQGFSSTSQRERVKPFVQQPRWFPSIEVICNVMRRPQGLFWELSALNPASGSA